MALLNQGVKAVEVAEPKVRGADVTTLGCGGIVALTAQIKSMNGDALIREALAEQPEV